MIDSHCHLDHEPLVTNFDQVILRSKKVGIKKILTICTTIKGFKNILKIIDRDPMIYGTFGIHPHETVTNLVDVDTIIKNVSNNDKVIGIGESGLDFYYNNSDKKSQIESLEKHIQAAIELNVPIIIHSRNAENETYDILKNNYNGKLKILMHCFTGSLKLAQNMLSLNAMFSASGIITFKNTIDLQNTFKKIPLENLLIETDSPFLAPVPMRGKKNEPSFIKYTLTKLAELKSVNDTELRNITTKNFNKLFSINDN